EHRGLAAARFDAIRSDILHRIAAPDLSLALVASRHGVSIRYVQHLFERAGTSFTGFVLEQRLNTAYRLLPRPSPPRRQVNDVASATGFAAISYFNRAFKARFAATPRDVRRLVDQSGAGPAPEAGDVPSPSLQPEWELPNSECWR